ncbi:hypothetical protein T484DRAFT_1891517 [Baffinella frigidus]|nr:hypothetical protein T484DRAFT_1891517 [Cryptophyta sp. CCMP2293]
MARNRGPASFAGLAATLAIISVVLVSVQLSSSPNRRSVLLPRDIIPEAKDGGGSYAVPPRLLNDALNRANDLAARATSPEDGPRLNKWKIAALRKTQTANPEDWYNMPSTPGATFDDSFKWYNKPSTSITPPSDDPTAFFNSPRLSKNCVGQGQACCPDWARRKRLCGGTSALPQPATWSPKDWSSAKPYHRHTQDYHRALGMVLL